jgi:hypothetical protein
MLIPKSSSGVLIWVCSEERGKKYEVATPSVHEKNAILSCCTHTNNKVKRQFLPLLHTCLG